MITSHILSLILTDSSHPFYMDLRQSGMAHGVYMRNSNGMDVIYDDGFLTYRMTGGESLTYFKFCSM